MSGVFSNAGKIPELLNFGGKAATMVVHDKFGGRMEISGARVVAEALPGVKHIIFGRASEGGKGREPAQPLFIIRDDGSDLRLLKHQFGHEDPVRVAGPSPGEIAPMLAIPTKQRVAKPIFLKSHRSTQISTDSQTDF